MDEVELGDLLEDEGQRMQYVFDPVEGRGLLMEISHIAYGKHIDQPTCRRRHGEPPLLALPQEERHVPTTEEILAQLNAAAQTDDDDTEPTDEELFEIEELDPEGFDFTEEG